MFDEGTLDQSVLTQMYGFIAMAVNRYSRQIDTVFDQSKLKKSRANMEQSLADMPP